MKVHNTTKGDLGLGSGFVVPAGGSLEIEEEQMEKLGKSKVVRAWAEAGWIVEGAHERSDKAEPEKTKKRKGLEKQAEALEIEFTADTIDQQLIESIKKAKAGA